ncbi:acyltransferase [Salegentibacter sp. UBA1130]|uniref:acyltransferase n=1 Tax=Salegentibacter sp. UBA1130 TaxID=1947451 RepID=UPI00257A237B|nr:acyltransferase [Salegentibacter sp. UBA1130]
MNYFKKTILSIPKLKNFKNKGYFNKIDRRNLLIYYFFKIIFGHNKESKYPIHFTSTLVASEKIKIGKNVNKSFLNSGGCYFQGINGIHIDDETIIGPGVKIISANHSSENIKTHVKKSAIMIGKKCWLGANSIILPGVQLGDNTIVAAGAVVSTSYKEGNIIIKGVPAK